MGRSKWKGSFFKENNKMITDKKDKIKIINKNISIVPSLINQMFKVHTGNNWLKLNLTEEMLNHKVGEFVFTRSKYIFKKKKTQKNVKKKK